MIVSVIGDCKGPGVGAGRVAPRGVVAAGGPSAGCDAGVSVGWRVAVQSPAVLFVVAKLAGRPGFRLPLSSAVRRR